MRVLLAAVLLVAPAVLALQTGGAVPVIDNDAGSGRDAPNSFAASAANPILISSGVVYSGWQTGIPLDSSDFFAFDAVAGDTIQARASGPLGCDYLWAPDGTNDPAHFSCTVGEQLTSLVITANLTGRWHFQYSYIEAQPYFFSIGVNEPAPHPLGLDAVLGSPPATIQPGDRVSTPPGACTLNFVYDGTGSQAGKVFIGTAAHCFTALGQRASADGLGPFGTLRYIGDYSAANTGTFENGIPGRQTDFSLIEVDAAFEDLVLPEVRGHPGLPSGGVLPAGGLVTGDRLDFSGYGLGFEYTQTTREERSGVYVLRSGNNWQGVGPIISGDSGGPVLHESGKAAGVATYIGALGVGGPILEVSLAEASAAGYPVTLRNAS